MTERKPSPGRRRRAFVALSALGLLLLGGAAVRHAIRGDIDGDAGADAASRPGGEGGDDAAARAAPTSVTASRGEDSPSPDRSARSSRRAAAPPTESSAEPPGRAGSDGDVEAVSEGAARSRKRPAPRFTLVGGDEDHSHRSFGIGVAIDGDIAAVAAPGFQVDGRPAGAAFVFERRDGVWARTQRLDSPRPDMQGFAQAVGVSEGRIVVFGGMATHANRPVFRSYVRSEDGTWAHEAETEFPVPAKSFPDVYGRTAFRGTTAVVGSDATLAVYEWRAGAWSLLQTIDSPPEPGEDRSRRWWWWASLRGDTLAARTAGSFRGQVVQLHRRREGKFVLDATIPAEADHQRLWTLDGRGDALVGVASSDSEAQRGLVVHGEPADGWAESWYVGPEIGRLEHVGYGSRIASDGDLVATILLHDGWQDPRLDVFQHREGTWFHTTIELPAGFVWSGPHPIALSGRTFLIGHPWRESPGPGGRAWFGEITDDDLARAVPLARGVRNGTREERPVEVGGPEDSR